MLIIRLQVEAYRPKLLHHVDKIFQIQALIFKANALIFKANALIFKANASKAWKVRVFLKTGSVNDHQNRHANPDVTAR